MHQRELLIAVSPLRCTSAQMQLLSQFAICSKRQTSCVMGWASVALCTVLLLGLPFVYIRYLVPVLYTPGTALWWLMVISFAWVHASLACNYYLCSCTAPGVG